MPPTNLQSHDFLGWKWRDNREFSVRSAYDFRSGYSWDAHEEVWKVVAAFRGLPRIRMFLWQAVWGRVLTNAERVRRYVCCLWFGGGIFGSSPSWLSVSYGFVGFGCSCG
ncbi:hypothetical protein GQ457_12G007480 [Hibiscus cannabinus]